MALIRGSGPFRGLAPFEETDDAALLGREDERKRVQAWLGQSDGGALLVTGEPGTGKTSLLRAVLLPQASAGDQLPFYVEILDGWEAQLRDQLARYVGRKLDPGDDTVSVLHDLAEQRESQVVLVLDQLEQLTWLPDPQGERLERLVAGVEAKRVRLVFGVERANLHVLGRIAGKQARIPDEQRILLPRLEREAVGQLIEQTILSGSGYMEAGLPDAIAEELCQDGSAVAADLQCVCDAAVREHALTLKAYQRAGGVPVLQTLYIERLAARVGGWRVRRALALIAEAENPRILVSASEASRGAGLSENDTRGILDALIEVGLLRAVEVPGQPKRYGLLHPYLRQGLRDFVAPLRHGRARARLALRRRASGAALFRPHELISIWRYLGRSLSDREQTRAQRSARVWAVAALIVLALPFLFYFGVYLKLSSTVYLSATADSAGTQRVMLRRGDPSLAFAFDWTRPSFGGVALDTGIAVASLPAELAQKVRDEQIAGALRDKERGVPRWLETLLKPIPAVRRGAFTMLAGQKEAGEKLLLGAATGAKSSTAERRLAARMLLLLSGDSTATRQALLACLSAKDASARRYAVAASARLSAKSAQPILEKALGDSDPLIRKAALEALVRLPVTTWLPLYGKRLLDADDRVQQAALRRVAGAVDKHPLTIFDILGTTLASGDKLRLPPIRARLSELRQRVLIKHGKALAGHLVALLARETNTARQAELVRFLVALSDHADPKRVLPVVEKLAKSPDLTVRAEAIGLQARFGKTEEVLELLQSLSRTYRPRRKGIAMRRAAAVGLGLLRGEAKTRLKVLKRLLNDPARGVRAAAVASLLRTGGPGLREVVNRMQRGFVDVGRAALDVVCRELTPNRRVATVVLSAAWKVRGGRLRQQALGCAQSLAAASFRLSMWLADQATVLKEPAMRRAAAPAVALALQKRGRGLARLARFYLRDRDPGVRRAVLTALAKRLPAKPAFLFRYVEPLTRAADPTVRAASAALLVPTAKKPQVALAPLVKLLEDDEATVRRAAVRAARALPKGWASGLKGETKKLRQALERALAHVVSRGRGSDTLEALKSASALGLRTPLERAATHPEARVRAAAVERLSATGDKQTTLQVLEAARRDSEPTLRLAALRAIAARSDRLGADAVKHLARSANAKVPGERHAAFRALGAVKGEAATSAAIALLKTVAGDNSEERRQLAMIALGALSARSDEAGEALFIGARDPAHDVRDQALGALAAYVARSKPQQQLWQLLLGSERDSVQRRVAVAALALSGRRAAKGLAALATREEKLSKETATALRIAARLALALARVNEAPVPLLNALYDR
jgi:HEAT repeat protein